MKYNSELVYLFKPKSIEEAKLLVEACLNFSGCSLSRPFDNEDYEEVVKTALVIRDGRILYNPIPSSLKDGVWLDVEMFLDQYNVQAWYTNIPEQGYPCWVTDVGHSKDKKDTAVMILKREGGLFFDIDNISWVYATPVKPEDCYQGDK